ASDPLSPSAAVTGMTAVTALNVPLEREAPALFRALSPLGRRAYFPPDIPVQAGEARGKRWNATTGQVTAGAGGAVGLPRLAAALAGLAAADRHAALLD